jgi:hypothetical protein
MKNNDNYIPTPGNLLEPGAFVLGCNYWASNAGAEMWRNFDAAVIDLQRRVVTLGERSIKTVSEYLVFFKRTDGTVCRYPVSEEFYSGFEIGQRGSVSVIDGAVYAFRLEDENIVE